MHARIIQTLACISYPAHGNWCFLNCLDNSFFFMIHKNAKIAFCLTEKNPYDAVLNFRHL